MRVTHVVHVGHPWVGGSEHFVHEVSCYLQNRPDVEVAVLTSAMSMAGQAGIVPTVDGVLYNYARIGDAATYAHELEALEPDVVMVFGSNVWPATLYPPDAPYPLVWLPCWPGLHPAHSTLFRQARVCVAISPDELYCDRLVLPGLAAHEYMEFYATPLEKLRQRYQLPERYLYLPGGTWPHKRVELAEFALDGLDILAICTGGGPPLNHLTHVRHLGIIPRRDVMGLYLNCEFVVSASEHESFGLTFLEAMAAGKVYVAFKVGMADRLGGGYTAYSMAEWRERVEWCLQHPAFCADLGQANKLQALQYNWNRTGQQLYDIYREIA